MDDKENTKEFRNVLIASLLLIAIFLPFHYYFENKINKCSRITVGTVIGFEPSFEGGSSPVFRYSFSSTLFNNYGGGDMTNINKLNSRYFLRISCEDPNISKVIEGILVPDTLNFIPENGWEKIPYKLDKIPKKTKFSS